MQYQELSPISHNEAEKVFAGNDPAGISEALVRLALHDIDRVWVERQCIRFIQHPNILIQRSAIISIGHLVRIHRALNTDATLPLLQEALKNPEIAGYANDTIDDIRVFGS